MVIKVISKKPSGHTWIITSVWRWKLRGNPKCLGFILALQKEKQKHVKC